MPTITTDDGVSLYYEESGTGTPIIFVHEFAGDYRSWEAQMRFFSRRHRAIAYNARGWPPSQVPDTAEAYSQDRACADILTVLDALAIDKAHIVGLSMGGFATLHFGMNHPDRATSLLIAGVGYGAEPEQRARFQGEADVIAALLRTEGMEPFANAYAFGPTRVQFENKDPRGFSEFRALTQQQIQKVRPSIFDLEERMQNLRVPTLIVTGDEDWPCLTPSVFMKKTIPSAGLWMIPNTGHTCNLEEPAAFNAALAEFIAQVEADRWPQRDSRAVSTSITGMGKN